MNTLPILKVITPEKVNEDWLLHLNTTEMKNLGIAKEGLLSLLKGLDIEIVTEEPLKVKIPENISFEDYLQREFKKYTQEYEPRPLSEEEIEDIVSVIPQVLSPIQESGDVAREEIISRLKEQLREIELTPLGIADYKHMLVQLFESARVEPGRTVGLTVAEALSDLTQKVLNAFKTSGARSGISSGVQLIQDLLSGRVIRKFESCTIHFWNEYTPEEVLRKKADFVEITIGNLINDYRIDSPESFEFPWWLELWPQLTGEALPQTSTIIEMEVNKVRMVAHEVTMEDIANGIEECCPGVTYVPGPADDGLIYIFPDEESVKTILERKRIPIASNAAEAYLTEVFLPQLDNISLRGITGIKYITPVTTLVWGMLDDVKELAPRHWNLIFSSFRMTSFGISLDKIGLLLNALGFRIISFTGTTITAEAPNDENPRLYIGKRIADVNKEVEKYSRDKITNQQERRKAKVKGEPLPDLIPAPSEETMNIYRLGTYVTATTDGSNLISLFIHPEVDPYKTRCNNPYTTLRYLGIEAARNLLIQELQIILEGTSTTIDSRHITLVADFMTNRGSILPIDFRGVTRQNPGPLTLSSFEKPLDTFRIAAAFGEGEVIRSSSAAIFTGRVGEFGTGYVNLDVNKKKVKEFEEELERKKQISAQDLAAAIENIDMVTFGSREEIGEVDIASQLAGLTYTPGPPETKIGTEEIPPIQTSFAPVVSPLLTKTVEGIQLGGDMATGGMATPHVTEETKEEKLTVKPLPPRIKPVAIPRARIRKPIEQK